MRKYLLYAIGEIMLVVIGIIIALQFNTWHQNLENRSKETRYLTGLVRDLEGQLDRINYQIESENDVKFQLEALMEEYQATKTIGVNEENRVRIHTITGRTTYLINDPTYTELLSTGNLELISDVELRDAIVTYYETVERTSLILQKNNDMNDNTIMPEVLQIVEYWPYTDFQINSKGFWSYSQDSLNTEGPLPSTLELTKNILQNDENLFRLLNLIKLRHSLAIISQGYLQQEKILATELIEKIRVGI